MKAFESFIKPFEAPQRSLKSKIFSLRTALGREGLNPAYLEKTVQCEDQNLILTLS